MDVDEPADGGDVRHHCDQQQRGEHQVERGVRHCGLGETRQVRREHTGGADIHGALSAIHRAHPRVDARDLALRPRIGDEQGAGERGEGEPEPERIASVVSGDAREGSDLRVSVDGGIEELARVGGGAAGARHHSVQGVEDGAGDHQPATESEAAHCKRRRGAHAAS